MGVNLSQAKRFISLLWLVAVLAIPALLLAAIQKSDFPVFHLLLGSASEIFIGTSGAEGAPWIIVFYILTALAYTFWDLSIKSDCNEPRGAQELPWYRPYPNAASYWEFVRNWLRFSGYAALIAFVCFVLCVASIHVGTQEAVGVRVLDARSLVVVIITLTYGYAVADYTFNRHFYFRRGSLDQITNADRSLRLRMKLLIIVSLGLLVVGSILLCRAAVLVQAPAS